MPLSAADALCRQPVCRIAEPPDQGHWLVVACRPRQDKLLFSELPALDLHGVLLLEQRTVRRPGKGAQTSWSPVFPGYLFVCTADVTKARERIYATGRVRMVLDPPDQPRFAIELADCCRLIECCQGLVGRGGSEIGPGDQVRLTHGALAGLQGTVARVDGRRRLVVTLTVLGQTVSTDLDALDAEPVLLDH